MINITNEKCTGCGACVSVCPTECLSIQISSNGEYRPSLEKNKCIQCNRCNTVCYIDNSVSTEPIGKAFFGWAKNNEERVNSTSGGIAQVLARKILINGGVVCGASSIDISTVKHVIIRDLCKLESIRGTKYVESNISEVFQPIAEALSARKMVLFIGLPCQVYALKSYLKNDYTNLFLIELFCHGAPRIGVYKKYIKLLQKKHGDIKRFDFRSKFFGWNQVSYEIAFYDCELHQKHKDNIYHLMFGYHNSLRSSCYNCQCRSNNRCADISCGDFWGVETFYKGLDLKKGISAVFVNTQKGQTLIDSISSEVELYSCKKEEILKKNIYFVQNYTMPHNQEKYNLDYKRLSSSSFFKKYKYVYKWYRIKEKLGRK